MILNKEQQEAVSCREGVWLWLATAGSGKTTVLVERVKSLLMSSEPMNGILALTFTTEAAKNMSSRLGMLSPQKGDKYGFKTFHSFGLNVLFTEKEYLSFQLAENPWVSMNGSKIFRQILKSRGINLDKSKRDAVRSYISKMKRSNGRLSEPSPIKHEVENDDSRLERLAESIYTDYLREMRQQGQIDFDDMLVESVRLLEVPEIRARWQFKWVHCDEGQDTDSLQFRMLQLISEKYKNVFIVGDINQSIYAFRGAEPENLERISDWFPDAKIRILPENFRSTPEIVDFGKQIAPIKNDLIQNLRTANSNGDAVQITKYNSTASEVKGVLDLVEDAPAGSAILARTNKQVGFFETECTIRGVKFFLLGKSGFWKTSEIKSVISLSNFVLSKNSPDSYAQRLVCGLRNTGIRGFSGQVAVEEIIRSANLRDFYADADYADEDNFALENLRAIGQIAGRFNNLEEFVKFSNKASHASRRSKKAVSLGTIHAAKGLEFNRVFVVGAQDGTIPHTASLGNYDQLSEEQRIFYVAVSRPSHNLHISYVGEPTRFLEDVEGGL